MSDPINLDDPAVKSAIESAVESIKAKNKELMDEVKETKRKLRSATEISPDDVAALEAENDKLKSDLAAAQKEAKDATKAAETASKALETESLAARSYALDAELSGAIAEGNVVSSLVPGFKAMMQGQAKADLVDGKYVVQIGDKPAREHIKAFLDSEEGKAWRAAQQNGGGGAPGGGGGGASGANPFSKESRNLTEQGRLVREDPAKAKELASAAGVSI